MRPPMTEEEEHANVIVELGLLCGCALELNGRFPDCIRERFLVAGIDIQQLTTREIADYCAAIRAEFPDLLGERLGSRSD